MAVLLNSGADPNAQSDYGGTSLIYAAQYERSETVTLLLANKANPMIKNKGGWSALKWAFENQNKDIAIQLKEGGAYLTFGEVIPLLFKYYNIL